MQRTDPMTGNVGRIGRYLNRRVLSGGGAYDLPGEHFGDLKKPTDDGQERTGLLS